MDLDALSGCGRRIIGPQAVDELFERDPPPLSGSKQGEHQSGTSTAKRKRGCRP